MVNAINGGTTAPGLFALAGPAITRPYEYTLCRGPLDWVHHRLAGAVGIIEFRIPPTPDVASLRLFALLLIWSERNCCQRKSMAGEVADELRRRILAGEVAEGTQLTQEQLAAEFGISKVPVPRLRSCR